MTEETTKTTPVAKKEKPPAIEEKPFTEFMENDFNPALKAALAKKNISDLVLNLEKTTIPIKGFSDQECWQLIGDWQNGDRQFNIYFLEGDIKGQKVFSYTVNGSKPSTLESFMIDERKVTLDLMLLYTLQRLNGQKWLGNN